MQGYSWEIPSWLIDFELLPDITDALGDADDYLLDYIECYDTGSSSFSNNTFCDNFHDDNCFNQTIENSLNTVCCTASRSCQSSANITSSNIRCDGSRSCYLSPFIEILNPSVKNVYISGDRGARNSKIEMTDGYGSGYGYADIHCRAAYSCGYSDIINTGNVYFVASQTGWDMNSLLNVNGNIYGYGRQSLRGVDEINNVNGNIYCGGYETCDRSNMYNINGSIYGSGSQAISYNEILNVRDSVYAVGYECARRSEMSNIPYVVCIGLNSCYGAIITNVNELIVYGTHVLGEAEIYTSKTGISPSNLGQGNDMIIKINGTIDTKYNIYCLENDTVTIDCQSHGACKNLLINCAGSCYVNNCNSNATNITLDLNICPTIINVKSDDRKCYQNYECAYKTYIDELNNTNSTNSSDIIIGDSSTQDIECYGSHSCANVGTIEIAQTVDINIECRGAFSCVNTDNIKSALSAISYDSNGLRCTGLFSCAFVSLINMFEGFIDCSGELSCYQSIIIMDSSASDQESSLTCNGFKSCSETTIYIIGTYNTIDMNGYAAAQNSLFITNGSGINVGNNESFVYVDVEFDGAMSGKNATFICNTGDVCEIECNSDACNELNVICNNCRNLTIDCQRAQKSDVCNKGYGYVVAPWIIDFELLPDISETFNVDDYYDDYIGCYNKSLTSNNDNLFCDNYQGGKCYNNTDGINALGTVCCNAYESCRYTSSVSSNGIRCDGAYSCRSINLINITNSDADAITTANGDLYFSGQYSAPYTSRIITSSNNPRNISCNGHYACAWDTNIENVYNLYIFAYQGLYDFSSVKNVYGNVYAYGSLAAYRGGNFSNINGNIYCGGYEGCRDTIIRNVNGSIFGNGYETLEICDIRNVVKSVYGIGREALGRSYLNNINYVVCGGTDSCERSTIINVNRLIVYGSEALSGSTIYTSDFNSSDSDSNTMVMKINGTNSETYNVFCLENDIIKIDCQSHYGCKYMNLYCNGTCLVDCNENTTNSTLELNYCPTVIGNNVSYALWKTDEPTNMPTSSPTTGAPTLTPVRLTTTLTTTTPMITNDNNESENNSSSGPSDAISITLIICVTIVIIASVAAITFVFSKKAEIALQTQLNQQAT